jgi:lysophospholipase L1-like esterase
MSDRIICLGDSITEGIGDAEARGWVGRLGEHVAKTYPGKWRVINLGVAGDTSGDIYHRLLNEATYRNPGMLIIAAGLNDAVSRLWPDSMGPKTDFNYARDVWTRTLLHLKGQPYRTVFIGLTPVNPQFLPNVYQPYDERDNGVTVTNETVMTYNAMLGQLVSQHGFIFIDIFESLLSAGYVDTVKDGLHPTSEGHDMMLRLILSRLIDFEVF